MKTRITLLAFLSAALLGCSSNDRLSSDPGAMPVQNFVPGRENKKQIAKVTHSFSGCFAGGTSCLVVSRLDSGYMADFTRWNRSKIEKKITPGQFAAFEGFIKDLKKFDSKSWGCTTTETFAVVYNNEVIERSVEDCSFGQYDKLLATFGFSYEE